jgi:hypothetical protein
MGLEACRNLALVFLGLEAVRAENAPDLLVFDHLSPLVKQLDRLLLDGVGVT